MQQVANLSNHYRFRGFKSPSFRQTTNPKDTIMPNPTPADNDKTSQESEAQNIKDYVAAEMKGKSGPEDYEWEDPRLVPSPNARKPQPGDADYDLTRLPEDQGKPFPSDPALSVRGENEPPARPADPAPSDGPWGLGAEDALRAIESATTTAEGVAEGYTDGPEKPSFASGKMVMIPHKEFQKHMENRLQGQMQAMVEEKLQLFTEDEVAALCRVRKGTVAKWRQAGEGPNYISVGRVTLYRQAALVEWLKYMEQPPTPNTSTLAKTKRNTSTKKT